MPMVMSGTCHHDSIYDFGQFMIIFHDFITNFITWDVNSLLRDAHFLHVNFFNPQERNFNFTSELPLLHPTSRKSLICNVETDIGFNESSPSSIRQSHFHENMDCGHPANVYYYVDFSLIDISCHSFPKGSFHDLIVDSLEEYYQSGRMSCGLYLHALHRVLYGHSLGNYCCCGVSYSIK